MMRTDTPPPLRDIAGALVKTTLAVLGLTIVYPHVFATLAHAFGAGR